MADVEQCPHCRIALADCDYHGPKARAQAALDASLREVTAPFAGESNTPETRGEIASAIMRRIDAVASDAAEESVRLPPLPLGHIILRSYARSGARRSSLHAVAARGSRGLDSVGALYGVERGAVAHKPKMVKADDARVFVGGVECVPADVIYDSTEPGPDSTVCSCWKTWKIHHSPYGVAKERVVKRGNPNCAVHGVHFDSRIARVGELVLPPVCTGIRVMMMPFRLEDPDRTLPDAIVPWRHQVHALCRLAPQHEGTAYLTIDEALVHAGTTHRRPGLHVDGVGEDGNIGGWGGGGGYAGQEGMLLVSSEVGCRGWNQRFAGRPGPDGDCAHLASQCSSSHEVTMQPGQVYLCSPLAVHEALPMPRTTWRQFARLSMPSNAPWYEGYTRNPLGIEPTGPIRPRRAGMDYRP